MKFVGKIGFWLDDVETKPGVYEPAVIEKPYMGDQIKQSRQFKESNEDQNPKFKINTILSIYADLYMRDNWPSIRYVVLNGAKWNISEVTLDYPKVMITLGGRYNENEIGTT